MKRNFSLFAPTFAKKENVLTVAPILTNLTVVRNVPNGGNGARAETATRRLRRLGATESARGCADWERGTASQVARRGETERVLATKRRKRYVT